ncbi:MAG: hypothetical protein LBO05_12365, partial [Deltaproteobacteria bacterium]|nr:hypothetical protein [Deltaproteobacteria bacterium]
MPRKNTLRIVVDFSMLAALFLLLGFHLWGQKTHEWLGVFMLALYAAHHALNVRFYKNIIRRPSGPGAVLKRLVGLLVLVVLVAQIAGGIVVSRHVHAYLPLPGDLELARRI